MRSKGLVDQLFVTIDLGEHKVELEGVSLPRYSTWQLGKNGAPADLIALSKLLPATKVSLSETLSKADQEQVSRLIRKELKSPSSKTKAQELKFIKNVLISLFKSLYVKRGYWSADLNGDSAS